MLVAVSNEQTGQKYWEAVERNAFEEVSHERFGNGVVSIHDYDPLNNLLVLIDTIDAQGGALQALRYEHNRTGSVTNRRDDLQGVDENFRYDSLQRLIEASVCEGQHGMCTTQLEVQYDAIGNITYRSDMGNYGYDGSRPNAVTEVRAPMGFGGRATRLAYGYDGNGNQVSRPGYSIGYTTHNLPRGYFPTTEINPNEGMSLLGNTNTVTSSAVRVDFKYDADANRAYKRAGQTRTHYVSGIFERDLDSTDDRRRHYIFADGRVVAEVRDTYTLRGQAISSETVYFHLDGLGSTDVITNAQGAVVERQSFGPFGEARDPNWHLMSSPPLSDYLAYGFTGHESDKELGLINMQGRIYDPRLGRFLSADPILANVFDTQSVNRYSYVRNNPLSAIDPTGYEEVSVTYPTYVCPTTGTQITVTQIITLPDASTQSTPAGLAPPASTATGQQSATAPQPNNGNWAYNVGKGVAGVAWDIVNPLSGVQDFYSASVEYYQDPGAWTGVKWTVALVGLIPLVNKAGKVVKAIGRGIVAGGRAIAAGGRAIGRGIAEFGKEAAAGARDMARATANAARRAWGWLKNRFRRQARGQGPACFVAGTLVLGASGYVPIETLRVGDQVWAQTEPGAAPDLYEITHTFVREARTLEVEVETPDGSIEVIVTTQEHPFYTDEGWLPAGALDEDSLLRTVNGEWLRVLRVELTGERETVYNFTVANAHTYFVGGSSVWVHNAIRGEYTRLAPGGELERIVNESRNRTTPPTGVQPVQSAPSISSERHPYQQPNYSQPYQPTQTTTAPNNPHARSR